jgi:twitching motility protein PilT
MAEWSGRPRIPAAEAVAAVADAVAGAHPASGATGAPGAGVGRAADTACGAGTALSAGTAPGKGTALSAGTAPGSGAAAEPGGDSAPRRDPARRDGAATGAADAPPDGVASAAAARPDPEPPAAATASYGSPDGLQSAPRPYAGGAGSAARGLDVDRLLQEAVRLRASDVHLTVESPPVVRVDGRLRALGGPPLTVADTRAALAHLASPEQRSRVESAGECDFSYSLPGVGRFRVNAYRQRGSIGLALRTIASQVPTFADLGLPGAVADVVRRPSGLVLVVGRAGSGRSSTLAAMIDLINSEQSLHVVTLEDPIEYLHRHKRSVVNQREIGVDSHSFAVALRAALRQDPDVILVGEVRDAETIATALTAAETGRLVLAAAVALDAAQAIERLAEVFPPNQQEQVRLQLSGALQAVVAQRLLPRRDGRGRVAAVEVLVATPAVRNLIREGKDHQLHSLIQAGAKHGMLSMETSLRELYERGLVEADELRDLRSGPFGSGGSR